MKFIKNSVLVNTVKYLVIGMYMFLSCFVSAQQSSMMIRIAEIEIHPECLEAYNDILKEEAEASVRLEPGVLAIFPMSQTENPTRVRIVEIYANETAYQRHLQTPHFLKYKNQTLKMIKDLKLIDMQALDKESMYQVFRKISNKDTRL